MLLGLLTKHYERAKERTRCGRESCCEGMDYDDVSGHVLVAMPLDDGGAEHGQG